MLFDGSSSAAVSKRNLSVICWILLLDRAPCALAKQLHLEYRVVTAQETCYS